MHVKSEREEIQATESRKYYSEYIQYIKNLERIVKGLSIAEIDIFRGVYHYIPTSNTSFLGKALFIFVLVFTVLRLFFQFMLKFHDKELIASKNSPGKISFYFIIFISFSVFSFSEILYHTKKTLIENLMRNSFLNSLLSTTVLDFFAQNYQFSVFCSSIFLYFLIIIIYFFKINSKQREFFNLINSFFIAVMGFNFFFLNYGLGFLLVIVLYLNEYLFYFLDETPLQKSENENPENEKIISKKERLMKKIKIVMILIKIVYSILLIYFFVFSQFLNWKQIIINFQSKPNCVFPILATIIICLLIQLTKEVFFLSEKIRE